MYCHRFVPRGPIDFDGANVTKLKRRKPGAIASTCQIDLKISRLDFTHDGIITISIDVRMPVEKKIGPGPCFVAQSRRSQVARVLRGIRPIVDLQNLRLDRDHWERVNLRFPRFRRKAGTEPRVSA